MWTEQLEGGSPPREVLMNPVSPARTPTPPGVSFDAMGTPNSVRNQRQLGNSSGAVPGLITATRAPPRAVVVSSPSEVQRKSSSDPPTSNSNNNNNKSPRESTNATTQPPPLRYDKEAAKRKQIMAILEQPVVDLAQLKKLCWSGIPPDLRPNVWKILLGCVPTQLERRQTTVARKRAEYSQLIPEYEKRERSGYEAEQLKQIEKDVPRPHIQAQILCDAVVQRSISRMLYLWALRHPVVGYVQGFNDLICVFFSLSLWESLGPSWASAKTAPSQEHLIEMEADAFWALAKLIDGMQDVYTNDRRGLFRMMAIISALVKRVDPVLATHFENEKIDYDLFAVPWINCLLLRAFPLELVWRLYDTYFAEGDIAKFHPYVCVAFLTTFGDKLKQMSFQEALQFLQHPPTSKWGKEEMEVLLSQAFLLQETYHDTVSKTL